MNLAEVAVYALVLAGPSATLCRLEGAIVACSNGLTAEALTPSETRFSTGVTVTRRGDQYPAFSNGITSSLSGGWLIFSNGVAVRRVSLSRYDFASGIACQTVLPDLIDCRRVGP